MTETAASLATSVVSTIGTTYAGLPTAVVGVIGTGLIIGAVPYALRIVKRVFRASAS